ncbi:AsmA-like C-terminal domain-containing protein [Hippea maritima]|uniref:Uncharacterized protein n=1 Tax=Hippea maritima (strain ATCC 700847 / DSM 10411 / MH2) TaxID=760142 RepID=F2LVY2_HIPMA|nr:AsmA-like C-terminal domain-containing protein [Hippea maritima]AEA33916.1 hypothetical protein Hipma_0947 [Hippea maritima DSM 10411]
MKRILKYFAPFLLTIALMTAAASVVVWNKIDAAFISNLIYKETKTLSKNGNLLKIYGLSIKKSFPDIIITIKRVSFKHKKLHAEASQINDKISIPKAILSKLFYGNYAGSLHISSVAIKHENTKVFLEKPNIELFIGKKIHIKLLSNAINTPFLNLKKIKIKAVFNDELDYISLKMLSCAGFYIRATIRPNKKDLKESQIDAKLKTPFIDVSSLRKFLKAQLRPYIFSGLVKIDDLKLQGKPNSLRVVKSGELSIKQAIFRIDLKSSNFYVKKAKVKIYEDKIKAIAEGRFEQIKTSNSEFIVYRKKGYPMEMHLHFNGNANEYVRVFLEENIFPENDLKVLGKTKNLKGMVNADIDIYEYKRKPKPYFDFDIKLYSKSVELENSNIPGGWVKTNGFLQIKRITKNGLVKKLFLRFKNFNAQTHLSTLYTKDFTLTLNPKLSFNGKFNLNIAKNDLNFFVFQVIHKKSQLNIKKANIKAVINGAFDNFNFKTTIKTKSTINKVPLNLSAEGKFKRPVLYINKLNLFSIGNISFSGNVNMKSLTTSDVAVTFKKVNLNSITPFFEKIPNIRGIINGKIKLTHKNGKFTIEGGELSINNGGYSFITNMSARITMNKSSITISSCSFDMLNNQVLAYGQFDINKKGGLIKLFADNFTLDLANIKTKKKNNHKLMVTLPNILLKLKINILNLTLKNGKNKTKVGATTLNSILQKNGFEIELSSLPTKIKAIFKNRHLNIKITDRAVWGLLTQCKTKNATLNLTAQLTSPSSNKIGIETLHGSINFTSLNGCIENGSSSLSLFNIILNPFKSLTTKINVSNKINYKFIKGNLFLYKGELLAKDSNPVILDGDIEIFGYGKYKLLKKQIDAYITFVTLSTVNKVISKIPVVGWILGGKEESFTGLSFHVKGDINNPSIKPVPFKSLAKGVLGVVKRTLMLPLSIFGVK